MTYRIYKTCYRIYKFCACKRFWLVYFDYFIYLCQQKVQEEMGGSGSGSGGGGGSSDSDSTPTLTMEQTPLTFEAAEAEAKVTFTIKVATDPVEYSRDGKIWSPYTSDEAIELTAVGDKVSFRGTNAVYASGYYDYSNISCDKDCYIYGNIMSLIKKEDFENVTAFTADYTFLGLFRLHMGLADLFGVYPDNSSELLGFCFKTYGVLLLNPRSLF